jgi:histidinol-phosphate/aromatic aminotransferase/cobyric acid decarboxylase-like protein
MSRWAVALHSGAFRDSGISAHRLQRQHQSRGPAAAHVCGLRAALNEPANLNVYPDLEQIHLRQALARSTGLTLHHISVGNGFVPLLEATLRAFSIRSCLLPLPAFSEYQKTLISAKVEMIPHLLTSESSFHYPFCHEVLQHSRPESCLYGSQSAFHPFAQ